jgi:hypothetical protein
MVPGNPIANMVRSLFFPDLIHLLNDIFQVFKCYSIETLYSAQLFTQDLKLGHYIKIPPRTTFMVQLIASCLSIVTQIGVKQWLFATVKDICSPTQKDNLTCPRNWVYFNASAIWYVIPLYIYSLFMDHD